jgi:hypothetical protein
MLHMNNNYGQASEAQLKAAQASQDKAAARMALHDEYLANCAKLGRTPTDRDFRTYCAG